MSSGKQAQETDLVALSDACEAAFSLHRHDECQALASSLSHAAAMQGLRSFEARGLLRQAQCELRLGHYQPALDAAQRAALLYEITGDTAGEIEALALAGQMAMLQCRQEDAIEAVLLAARLAERLPASALYVLAHTELGMVHGWSGNLDAADAAFVRAVEAAHTIGQPQLAELPQCKRVLAAAVCRVKQRERHQGVGLADRATVTAKKPLQPARYAPRGDSGPSQLEPADQCLQWAATALAACAGGDPATAARLGAACDQGAGRLGNAALQALGAWVASEIALLAQRPADAAAEARRMLALAGSVGHGPLTEVAQLLLSSALQRQGQTGPARAVLFEMYAHQAEQRALALLGREQQVRWRLGVRDQSRRMQELERLSHEDPLTGLANRRAFDAALEALVWQWQTQARPFALLLIDVDRFKQINDQHSHLLGDEVLRRVGELLTGLVHEGDLVARLGGDEFVLLLRHQGGRSAESCRLRIEHAIRDEDWAVLAPRLSVSLSIGLARIAEGDGAEQILARADAGMYRHKARHEFRPSGQAGGSRQVLQEMELSA